MQNRFLIISFFMAVGVVALAVFSQVKINRSVISGEKPVHKLFSAIPQNAFRDNEYLSAAGQSSVAPRVASTQDELNVSSGVAISGPNIDALQELVPEFISPMQDEIFNLPVSDTDIKTGQEGASAQEYLAYLATNAQKINFDFQKLKLIPREGDSSYEAPVKLIQDVLDGKRTNIDESLKVYQELAGAKIAFEKEILVNKQDGKEAAKIFIGVDSLIINSINLFSEFQNGKVSKADLQANITKYKISEKFYLAELQRLSGSGAKLSSNRSIVGSALEAIGFLSVARALGAVLPFGGLITLETPCSCVPGSAEIVVGPPVGGAFITPPFMILYASYQPFPGHYILGLFTPGPLPCFGIFPACIPSSEGAVIMAGTSGI